MLIIMLLTTHPGFVKVLLDLEILHLAILRPGQRQEAKSHNEPQHATSEEGGEKMVRS